MWWTAARRWAEITTLSPLVISERMRAAAAAGTRPTAAHRAEMNRMVVEKGQAAAESATTLWFAAIESQQLAWQRAWRAGRVAPLPIDYAPTTSTARKLAQALSPVSRRVTANAKRLTAKKRKQR
jgi:hypothetical protein